MSRGRYSTSRVTDSAEQFQIELLNLTRDVASIRMLGVTCSNVGRMLDEALQRLGASVNPEGLAWQGQGAAAFGQNATSVFKAAGALQPAFANAGQAMTAYANTMEGYLSFFNSQVGALNQAAQAYHAVVMQKGGYNFSDLLPIEATVQPLLNDLRAFQEVFNPVIAQSNEAASQLTTTLMTLSETSPEFHLFTPPPGAVQEFVDGCAQFITTFVKDNLIFNPLIDPLGFAVGAFLDPKDTIDRFTNEAELLAGIVTPAGRARLAAGLENAFADTQDIRSGNYGGWAAFVACSVLTLSVGPKGNLDRLTELVSDSANELSLLAPRVALVRGLMNDSVKAADLSSRDYQVLRSLLTKYQGRAWETNTATRIQAAVDEWAAANPLRARALQREFLSFAYSKLPPPNAGLAALRGWCNHHPGLATMFGLTSDHLTEWGKRHALLQGLAKFLGGTVTKNAGVMNGGLQHYNPGDVTAAPT